MKKLTTLFKKDPENMGLVIDEINPENKWVYELGIPTRKFDGTSCAIINGLLYKRFDLKKGRSLPENSIPCQDADNITGHHPHWIPCIREDNSNKYHFEAFDNLKNKRNGTYELCGEKIQGNPENITGHKLIPHGKEILGINTFTFEELKEYLTVENIEGIVFHNMDDGRMCKIRKSDFGIKR